MRAKQSFCIFPSFDLRLRFGASNSDFRSVVYSLFPKAIVKVLITPLPR